MTRSRPPGAPSEAAARVLVVDDEPAVRRALARALMERGFAVDTAEGGRAALDLLRTRPADVVLLDRSMPDMDGPSVLAGLREEHPGVAVVMMVPAGDDEAAASALRAGAYDVVHKPVTAPELLCRPLERAAERRRLEVSLRAVEQRLLQHESLGEILSGSTRMAELDRRAASAASTSSPILVLGERGTGKELLARSIHRRSNRAREPLHILRLEGLPEDLAIAEILGALEISEGATLLLDDVGELGPSAQAALVRALADEARRRDVRMLATGLPELRERVKAGTFRQELFYRLSVIALEIPPLRRRRDDIPLLAYHFLSRFAPRAGKEIRRIGVEALRKLREHAWPGNVRELGSVIEHAVVMARGDVILPADLPLGHAVETDEDAEPPGPAMIAGEEVFEMPYADAKDHAVEAFDQMYVDRLMKRAGGNVSEAARLAGMDRSNFRRILKKARPEKG
jgi:DNA-binding NtrC family response regulator